MLQPPFAADFSLERALRAIYPIQIELTCLPKSAYSRAVSNSRVRLNLLFKKPGTDFIDSFSVYYGDWLKGEGWLVPDLCW